MPEVFATVVYRLPGEAEIRLLKGPVTSFDLRENNLEEQEGFIVHGFTEECYLVKPELSQSITEKEIPVFSTPTDFLPQPALGSADYLDELVSFKQKMVAQSIQKAIFSRVKKTETAIDIPATFRNMLHAYPKAFCFILQSELTGTWLGATPEKLINEDASGNFEIHSLAGTLPAAAAHWSEKEREEQQIVTDYITGLLKNNGISDYRVGERSTVIAGSVAHLRTTIHLPKKQQRFNRLVSLLHPTPAVCGTPTAAARQLILESEKHQRRLYTGFLGPIGPKTGNHLFVNLRCMEVHRAEADLFVGGGITAKSDPENEWNETELKSQTLLSVIVAQKNGL